MADEPITNAPASVPAAEKPGIATTSPTTVDATGTEGGKAEKTFTQSELDAIIKTRLEQADRKHKSAAEQAAAQAAEQSAIEQGKWKELYEKAKPLAERTTAAEAFIAELLEAETAAVPDKLKPLIPQGDALTTLRWVQQAKAVGILAAPQAPRTDAGAATTGVQPQRGLLTDEKRKEYASKYGFRLEDVPQQIGR